MIQEKPIRLKFEKYRKYGFFRKPKRGKGEIQMIGSLVNEQISCTFYFGNYRMNASKSILTIYLQC